MKNACCVCDSRESSTHYKNIDSYDLLKCHKCNIVYLDEVNFDSHQFIDDSDPKNGNIEFWSVPNLFEKHKEVFLGFFKQRLNKIKSLSFKTDHLLDIGSGYGFWSNYLHEEGLNIDGIEVSEKAYSYSKKHYSFPVHHMDFMDFNPTKKYDGVFLVDVLEHFIDPNLALSKVSSLLEVNGFVFIQVPDVLGFKYPFNHNLGLPYHVWQFNIESLEGLAKKHNLKLAYWWSGSQGIIPHYEKGGPNIITKTMWALSQKFKFGNRIQAIFYKMDASA